MLLSAEICLKLMSNFSVTAKNAPSFTLQFIVGPLVFATCFTCLVFLHFFLKFANSGMSLFIYTIQLKKSKMMTQVADRPQNLQNLKNRIRLEICNITPETIDNFHEEYRRRFNYCQEAGGWQFCSENQLP